MIVNPEIERYLHALLPPRDSVLAEMEAEAERRNIPIIGPAVARVLAQLVLLTGAKRIFELGSAIGYSTIWLARAAGLGAEVHYTDGSVENAREARGYFERAGLSSSIHVHVDVDKEGYPSVLDAVPARLKKGGIFATDNTLWYGRVLNPKDASDRAVVEFNRKLYESAHFFSTILPIRDGLTVAFRL